MTLSERSSVAMQAVAEGSGFAWGWVIACVKWLLACVCNGWDGLSLNRLLAILFGWAAVRGKHLHSAPLEGWDIAAMVIAGSLSFGEHAWNSYLDRKAGDAHA